MAHIISWIVLQAQVYMMTNYAFGIIMLYGMASYVPCLWKIEII
jgi:hypothetical protein